MHEHTHTHTHTVTCHQSQHLIYKHGWCAGNNTTRENNEILPFLTSTNCVCDVHSAVTAWLAHHRNSPVSHRWGGAGVEVKFQSPNSLTVHQHRRSQGVHWVQVHPPARRKKIGGQIYRGSCKCTHRQRVHPPRQSKSSIFFRKLGRSGDLLANLFLILHCQNDGATV